MSDNGRRRVGDRRGGLRGPASSPSRGSSGGDRHSWPDRPPRRYARGRHRRSHGRATRMAYHLPHLRRRVSDRHYAPLAIMGRRSAWSWRGAVPATRRSRARGEVEAAARALFGALGEPGDGPVPGPAGTPDVTPGGTPRASGSSAPSGLGGSARPGQASPSGGASPTMRLGPRRAARVTGRVPVRCHKANGNGARPGRCPSPPEGASRWIAFRSSSTGSTSGSGSTETRTRCATGTRRVARSSSAPGRRLRWPRAGIAVGRRVTDDALVRRRAARVTGRVPVR